METTRIPLSQCVESSYQNRKELGDVSGLARSIEVNGQITPLIVVADVNANIVSTDWANVSPRPRQPIPANRTNVLSPTAPTELCSPMALPHRDRSDYWMKGTSWAS